MITKPLQPLVKAALFFSLLLIISQFFQNELVFQRDLIEQGQWWRILSGNLVHANYPHLALNVIGLWIFSLLFIDSLSVKTFTFSLFFLSFCVGFGLYFFNPELFRYYGFSGILYGLFLIGAIAAIRQKDYFTGFSLLILVCAKVTWDSLNGENPTSAQLIGIPVAVDSHLYGLIGATIMSITRLFSNKLLKTHPPTF